MMTLYAVLTVYTTSYMTKMTHHSFKLELGADSWVFMYTDSYYDQLGGERMLSPGMDLFMAHLS